MAGSAELMSRQGRGSRRLPWVVAGLAVVVLLVVPRLAHRSGAPPVGTLVVTSADGSGAPTTREYPLNAEASQVLQRDVASLAPGRIGCGSPGPAGYVIRLTTATYDVNGECVRVVREGTSTALVESSELQDELEMLSHP